MVNMGPISLHLEALDDSLFFLKASARNCMAIKTILDGYCHASGQVVNFDKSNLFCSPNTPTTLQKHLGDILGVQVTNESGLYLGLPTLWRHSKNEALILVKENFLRKVQGWKQGLLSQASKEVIIKAVAVLSQLTPWLCFSSRRPYVTKLMQFL